ncbi:hypothetical protein FRC07_003964 [Ceratobasidium sp. 392]|nr:hypothetical protein FRC07_003964 [Ceratobasidium sp. 392]
MSTHSHRPTLKQQNKPFKSKHATKGSLKEAAKGRIGHSPKPHAAANAALAQNKLNRKNAAKQTLIKKRAGLADEGKIFHGPNAAPRIVAVIPLSSDVSSRQVAIQIVEALGVDTSAAPESGTWVVEAPRFRTSLQLLVLPYRHLYASLDAALAADYTLLALSPVTEVDSWGERLLRCLQSQGGLHNVVSVVQHPAGEKPQPGVQKSLLSFVQYFVPTQRTSTYQAAWIVDDADDEDEGDEDEDADAEMNAEQEQEHEAVDEASEEELVDLDVNAEDEAMSVTNSRANKSVAFEDMDMEEETRQLDTWRTRAREDADDLAFPDEIDTPQNTPAHTRFARFRGLRSFRTSPWDPYENLPPDYARTFQFEDYARTERSVRKYEDEHSIKPGTRVVICIEGVPRDGLETFGPGHPIVLFTLLQHEHKTAVLNFTVQRNTEYDGSVRSKDPMILCVGPRRFRTNPIYSQHTRGGGKGVNNVHKFERYLRHGDTGVASVYGPIIFGKQPCTLLRETDDPQGKLSYALIRHSRSPRENLGPELVASGTFLSTDAQRIIAKRIILTGHPFKVHKKTATVRYMFFNPEDVRYFAPIQLHTKHGRTGHIRESLGTHGYFKAHFDGPLTQMDTICMSLYKRMYPRWSEPFKLPAESGLSNQKDEDIAMEG